MNHPYKRTIFYALIIYAALYGAIFYCVTRFPSDWRWLTGDPQVSVLGNKIRFRSAGDAFFHAYSGAKNSIAGVIGEAREFVDSALTPQHGTPPPSEPAGKETVRTQKNTGRAVKPQEGLAPTGGEKAGADTADTVPPVQPPTAPKPADDPITSEPDQAAPAALTASGIISETNRQREAILGEGSGFKENTSLDRAAQLRAEDMIENQYFSHTSPSGQDMHYFVEASGYKFLAIGENLAYGNFTSDAAVVQGWMDSPGHRENILRQSYTEIGVAVKFGTYLGGRYWVAVQIFGTPADACAHPDTALLAEANALEAEINRTNVYLATLSKTVDAEKKTADGLRHEISDLENSGADAGLIVQKEAELATLAAAINRDVDTYNQKSAANKAAYDDYKTAIDAYNQTINDYNACLKGL